MKQAGMAADTRVEIGPRPVPQEPLVRNVTFNRARWSHIPIVYHC